MLIVKDTDMDNPFAMAVLAGKRAKDIVQGKPVILEPPERNAVTQSIKEVLAGAVKEKGK